ERVEVRVRDSRVPADDDVAADAQLQLRQKKSICEIAIVADRNPGAFSQGEMYAVQRAVRADLQRGISLAAKAFEEVLAQQDAVGPDADVARQIAVQPATRLQAYGLHHAWTPLTTGGVRENWRRCSRA